jgi:hypothetical protein
MSAMRTRFSEREDDRIYSMIGVIKKFPPDCFNKKLIHPAEYFMNVCEEINDFSFIYSIASRSEIPGKCWRPVAGKMESILFGTVVGGIGQVGFVTPTHLQLENMINIKKGVIGIDGLNAVNCYLQANDAGVQSEEIAFSIFERLQRKGFSGCGDYLELENGFFFPQLPFVNSDEIFVVACSGMNCTNFAPGLLLRSNGTDINQFCDVGVFVGRLPDGGESICIG